jgi:shikimate kinase
MGSGKTTIGQRLAQWFQIPFVDSDHEIEKAANLTIPELFARYGEAHFREGERRVIARLVNDVPKVVATGGGAFINDITRQLLLERAYVIWLDADIDMLVERTARRPGQRPLLRDRDPSQVLAELAAVRNPIYALAHLHVRNRTHRHTDAVEIIIQAMRQRRVGAGKGTSGHSHIDLSRRLRQRDTS